MKDRLVPGMPCTLCQALVAECQSGEFIDCLVASEFFHLGTPFPVLRRQHGYTRVFVRPDSQHAQELAVRDDATVYVFATTALQPVPFTRDFVLEDDGSKTFVSFAPAYSTLFREARVILDTLQQHLLVRTTTMTSRPDNTTSCFVSAAQHHDPFTPVVASADNLPLALCKVALLVVLQGWWCR